MNGGVTHLDMETRRKKAENLDAALSWLHGRVDSEKLMTVESILRDGLEPAMAADWAGRHDA